MEAVLTIYPTAMKAAAALRESTPHGCRLGFRVFTIPQLIDALAAELAPQPEPIGAIALHLLMDQALLEVASSHVQLASRRGLVSHMLRVVGQLKSGLIRPEDLAEAGRLDPTITRALDLTHAVFAAYEGGLRRNRQIDRHDREQRVLEGLRALQARGGRPRVLDGVERIVIAEVYDLSLLQFLILRSLIRQVGDARLAIQAEIHEVDAARFYDLTWNRFVAEQSIADAALPEFVRRGGRPGRLGKVLEGLFDEAARVTTPADQTIGLTQAASRLDEIEAAARAIRLWLEQEPGQRRLSRVAVVSRELELYAHGMQAIFARFGLPIRLNHGRSLAQTQVAKLIQGLLRLPLQDYQRSALQHLLRSGHLGPRARDWRDLLSRVGYVDRLTRPLAQCVGEYRAQLEQLILQGHATTPEVARAKSELEWIVPKAGSLVDIVAAIETLDTDATVAGHVRSLLALMDKLGVGRSLDLESAHGRSHAQELYAARQALVELAQAAECVVAERGYSLADFAALATEALEAATAAEPAGWDDAAVTALSVADVRGLDFDLVFLLGLDDGTFPLGRTDDPILPDEVRAALNPMLARALRRRLGDDAPSMIGRILRTGGDRAAEERFLFFLALSLAERRLVLSYPAADDQGRPLTPSPFIAEIRRLLPDLEPTSDHSSPARGIVPAGRCLTVADTLRHAARRGRWDWAGSLVESGRLESIRRRAEVETRREAYLTRPIREDFDDGRSLKAELATAYEGRVASGELCAHLFGTWDEPLTWKARDFDAMAGCGFRFFADRVLGLARDQELTSDLSAIEFGELTHDVLRDLMASDIDFGSIEAARESARRFLSSKHQEIRRRQTVRDGGLFALAWDRLTKIVEEMVEFECDHFARGDSLDRELLLEKSYDLDLGGLASNARLIARGRIDRLELQVDRGRLVRLRVLDYKTSRAADRYAKALSRERFAVTQFQLPVYLLAAASLLGPDAVARARVEAGYLVLRHRDKLKLSDPIDPRELALDAASRAAAHAAGVRPIADELIELAKSALAGKFDVDPRSCDDYCPYRQLCRFDKSRPRFEP